jgi:ABC-type Na+ transport system ATPase subunit NatA
MPKTIEVENLVFCYYPKEVLVAAALLHDPTLLLLDEPLSGLDVSTSLIIKELIGALAREGKTMLYSSHVLDVVERVCNRILISAAVLAVVAVVVTHHSLKNLERKVQKDLHVLNLGPQQIFSEVE